MPEDNLPAEFWTAKAEDALLALGSSPDGLTPEDAARRRDVFGPNVEIPVEEIVPGDIVLLKAGDIIPADCLVLDSKDLYANEASP